MHLYLGGPGGGAPGPPIHRIRTAWKECTELFDDPVEVDETYIGGKEKNRYASEEKEGCTHTCEKTRRTARVRICVSRPRLTCWCGQLSTVVRRNGGTHGSSIPQSEVRQQAIQEMGMIQMKVSAQEAEKELSQMGIKGFSRVSANTGNTRTRRERPRQQLRAYAGYTVGPEQKKGGTKGQENWQEKRSTIFSITLMIGSVNGFD